MDVVTRSRPLWTASDPLPGRSARVDPAGGRGRPRRGGVMTDRWPRISRRAQPLVRTDGSVQFGLEPSEGARVCGVSAPEVTWLRGTRRQRDPLASAEGAGIPRERAATLLQALRDAGVVLDPPGIPPPLALALPGRSFDSEVAAAGAPPHILDAYAAVVARADACVRVLGRGALAATLADVLRQSGIGEVDRDQLGGDIVEVPPPAGGGGPRDGGTTRGGVRAGVGSTRHTSSAGDDHARSGERRPPRRARSGSVPGVPRPGAVGSGPVLDVAAGADERRRRSGGRRMRPNDGRCRVGRAGRVGASRRLRGACGRGLRGRLAMAGPGGPAVASAPGVRGLRADIGPTRHNARVSELPRRTAQRTAKLVGLPLGVAGSDARSGSASGSVAAPRRRSRRRSRPGPPSSSSPCWASSRVAR